MKNIVKWVCGALSLLFFLLFWGLIGSAEVGETNLFIGCAASLAAGAACLATAAVYITIGGGQ